MLLGSQLLGLPLLGSHAHPLASCFVSLALMVSRISSVYLSKWHSSWRVRVREALSSWDRVLGRLVYLSRSSWARARTRSSGTSSRSSWSSRSSSSRSSSSRSSSRVCEQYQRQHATHQERPAQSNVHARPRDARVESAQANRPRACTRLSVARPLCRQQTRQYPSNVARVHVSITSEARRRAQARSVRIEYVVHERGQVCACAKRSVVSAMRHVRARQSPVRSRTL